MAHHTKENSATYLLVSNFKGSMKVNAFVHYLGLDVRLSKNSVLEDGTHKIFNSESVKVTSEPDMYIQDDKNKIFILIESKVRVDRELEESQTSEKGYLGIIKDYKEQGYKSYLVYLIPEGYNELKTLKEIQEKHSDEVIIVTWNTFFNNFDNDVELLPLKNAIQAIEIDGITIEQEDLSHSFDCGIISSSILKSQNRTYYYIEYLIGSVLEGLNGKYKTLLCNDKKSGYWLSPRFNPFESDVDFSSYLRSPCIEIIVEENKSFYIVASFDIVRQEFCVYAKNKISQKDKLYYAENIHLPYGEIPSYYAIENMLGTDLYNFYENTLKIIKTDKEIN